MNYFLHLLTYFEIYLIVALSLNFIVGYCGLLTLAHAAYFAVGGYMYALLSITLSWGFLPSVTVAASVAALLSLAVSLSAWRLKGDFFLLASLAVQVLIYSILYNWLDSSAPIGSWANLTNGPFGIAGIPKPNLCGYTVSDPLDFLAFASGITVFCALIVWRLKSSPWGRVLVAMREDELATRGLGKNTRLLKVQVFAISSALVAVAGALYAAHVSFLDPSSASLDESILMLSMVIVGGVGNFRGPVVGAAFLIALPELMRFLHLPDAVAANLRLAIYGILIVIMMHFRPQGISGTYRVS